MTDMNIARTILEQLGGQRFLVMTGAKHLIAGERDLRFRIVGRSPKGKRVNVVSITLEPSDTYKVETFYARKSNGLPDVQEISTRDDVYCDQLQECFTEMTGLYTRL